MSGHEVHELAMAVGAYALVLGGAALLWLIYTAPLRAAATGGAQLPQPRDAGQRAVFGGLILLLAAMAVWLTVSLAAGGVAHGSPHHESHVGHDAILVTDTFSFLSDEDALRLYCLLVDPYAAD